MLSIRPYEHADLDAVAALWLASWRSARVPAPEPIAIADTREALDSGVRQGWEALVAVLDGAAAGWMALQAEGPNVHELFVAPGLQRRGIGKALLSFAKTRFPEGFWLSAAEANRDACRFYEREGLIRGAREPHERWGWSVPSLRYDWRPGARGEVEP